MNASKYIENLADDTTGDSRKGVYKVEHDAIASSNSVTRTELKISKVTPLTDETTTKYSLEYINRNYLYVEHQWYPCYQSQGLYNCLNKDVEINGGVGSQASPYLIE